MSGRVRTDRRDDRTCVSLPLPPPRSLRGTENADTVWEMITRRFPNVAPLLCEMEAVIDRTQDLLQRLRVPYPASSTDPQGLRVPSRKEASSRREGAAMRETRRQLDHAEVRPDTADNSESVLEILDFQAEEDWQRFGQKSIGGFQDSPSCADESLERVDNGQRACGPVGNSREYSPNRTQESVVGSGGDVKKGEDKKEGERQSGESAGPRNPLVILQEYAVRSDVPVTFECTARPLKLSKTRRYIVDGQLAHYSASAFGETVQDAKNNFATKILRQVTFDQMRNESVAPLLNLTRQEMLEVMNLGTENQNTTETALTRLCRICLEKGEPMPVFSFQRCKTYEGICLTATCTALGYSGCGKAVSKSIAMKTAAEETYEKYRRGLPIGAADPS